MNKHVLVGLSGGVDSSLAAHFLLEKGYKVTGITMKIWGGDFELPENTSHHACYGPEEEHDIESAFRLCKDLGIKYYVIDLVEEYKESVITYFKQEYLAGRTPNPCVKCNQLMKFGFILQKARELGINVDYFATGHYARITQRNNRYLLSKAVDSAKDQTYFLAGLKPEQLGSILFPLGGFTKQEVRKMAKEAGLDSADAKESQDFITGGDYSPLFKNSEIKSGPIKNEAGEILGSHSGIINYTIGQRRGLGISADKPYYVSRIDADCNTVIVSTKEKLFSEGLSAADPIIHDPDVFIRGSIMQVKIRQSAGETAATLHELATDYCTVQFEEPQLSVAPGQTVVFYDNDIVVGSATIDAGIQNFKSYHTGRAV